MTQIYQVLFHISSALLLIVDSFVFFFCFPKAKTLFAPVLNKKILACKFLLHKNYFSFRDISFEHLHEILCKSIDLRAY